MRTFFCAFSLLTSIAAFGQTPHLYRSPAINESSIAFRYADDIWTVSREGGVARRLTSTASVTGGPYFSPDGKTLAYTASVAGNADVYTIAVTGGAPKRITYHPGQDAVVGWSPDGKDILTVSDQDAVRMYLNLYKVHADGSGLPEKQPLPSAYDVSYSPDGSHIAYNPFLQWEEASWKRYHGGQTQPIWIVDTKTLDTVKVPRENSNDREPVWIGDTVYFLSDRNAAEKITLYGYDTRTKAVKELIAPAGFDMKTLRGFGGTLAYEQFGTIHLYDIASGKEHEVKITADGDLPALLPSLEKIQTSSIENVTVSPTGVRAAFQAHGEIFTVPAEKGDTRNITNTTDAAEREPAWSPDGQSIAYFSDATGEYKLYIRDQQGLKAPKIIDLGASPTYYYTPQWSPDSKMVLFTDKRTNLWYVKVDGGAPVKVAKALHEGFGGAAFNATFSPDAKWILYARDLSNYENAAFVYDIATGKSTQITDGMSNVTNPVWDAKGKYVYFLASTDVGPTVDGFNLSSLDRTTTAGVYVAVLSKDETSPIPPESDDEKAAKADADKKDADKPSTPKASDDKKDAVKGTVNGDEKKDAAEDAKKLPEVKIDLEGIQERILALPIPARNYTALYPGKTGVLFLGESGPAANPASEDDGSFHSVWRFTLEKRKTEDVLHDVSGMLTSFDGSKLLYSKHGQFAIAGMDELTPAAAEGMPGKVLRTSSMVAKVDPRAEWKQMYKETWRIEREFFYDPNYHGLDLKKIEARYAPYVDGLSSRSDLTYLQDEMLGEMVVGHMFIRGPRKGGDEAPKTGLLGANYAIEHDRYRFTHVVHGANWSPKLYSPLTQPGVNVKVGEYLLAVNGVPLHATENLYEAFEGTAGKQVNITVGPSPDGKGSREVVVVPVDNDRDARNQEWIEDNIATVDKLSGGKIAYVYIPDTGGGGFTSFNRYFFSQVNKQGVILDDRWNQGGLIADWVIDVLRRRPMLADIGREGSVTVEPTGAIFGPKAMLINQNAGSGGDAMPWLFRQAGLGPLVGTRTWGGLVGIGGYPSLLDGGSVTAPRTALFGLHGEWEVENHGVAPDVEVDLDPKSVAAGHDPQLERAVQVVMEQMKSYHPLDPKVPEYPNYHKTDGLGR